ncbi:YuiA family protein [Hazenella sp. IB182357]|uniref:YuiA family protein n=1 Tax=Polycladospora coralii TaxID=2771432 RepID=A0A926RTA4_9BACL|nr:YuiA family protein [Polycladospora coralii]MBD1370904.1 YuiA family protein [Polycladospora coralii]MBS7529843.1 YuiA family protein [Polycladospora coralii]
MSTKTLKQAGKCTYCNGEGYVQLLLGGSETCHACHGTGKKEKPISYKFTEYL